MPNDLMLLPDQPRESQLPSEKAMEELDVAPAEFGDFMKAFNVIILQAQGKTLSQACREAGVAHSSAYEPKWLSLFSKARRLFVGKALLGLSGAANRVMEKWPELVERSIRDIEDYKTTPRDRVAILEFLYTAYLQNQGQEQDTSDQSKYLQSGVNFNPMQPLQQIAIRAEPGSTINISSTDGFDISNTEE